MKFIAKYIQVIGLLMLTSFVAAAAALYFDVPARLTKPRPTAPAPASVDKHQHAGCNHAASAPVESAASAGSAHAGGGCCSTPAVPTGPTSGCTRPEAGTPDHPTP